MLHTLLSAQKTQKILNLVVTSLNATHFAKCTEDRIKLNLAAASLKALC